MPKYVHFPLVHAFLLNILACFWIIAKCQSILYTVYAVVSDVSMLYIVQITADIHCLQKAAVITMLCL